MTKAKRARSGAPDGKPASENKRLERAARVARGAAKSKRDDDPISCSDLNLIGYVTSRSLELGCGLELFDLHVAPLRRRQRVALCKAIEAVVSATEYDGIPNHPMQPTAECRRQFADHLTALCGRIGCEQVADAFNLSKADWRKRYEDGAAAQLDAPVPSNANPERPGQTDPSIAAVMAMVERMIQHRDCGDAIRNALAGLRLEDWSAAGIRVTMAAIITAAPDVDRRDLAHVALALPEVK